MELFQSHWYFPVSKGISESEIGSNHPYNESHIPLRTTPVAPLPIDRPTMISPGRIKGTSGFVKKAETSSNSGSATERDLSYPPALVVWCLHNSVTFMNRAKHSAQTHVIDETITINTTVLRRELFSGSKLIADSILLWLLLEEAVAEPVALALREGDGEGDGDGEGVWVTELE